MAVQTLNEVQRDLVNETVRPSIEKLVSIHDYLDALVLELDNQQDPIAQTADELGDNETGDAPRSDAPTLTGNDIANLRNFAANMRDQISSSALNTLVEKSVRDVNAIRQLVQ